MEPAVVLFSESGGRALVEVTPEQSDAFVALAAERGTPCVQIGRVRTFSSAFAVEGLFEIPLDELRLTYTQTLPTLFA